MQLKEIPWSLINPKMNLEHFIFAVASYTPATQGLKDKDFQGDRIFQRGRHLFPLSTHQLWVGAFEAIGKVADPGNRDVDCSFTHNSCTSLVMDTPSSLRGTGAFSY